MLRVMLVDDSQKEVSLLMQSLLDVGYEVVQVSANATALLESVAEVNPDVIIIDAESPTRDTLEQLSFVSERRPRPIVLFTGDREHSTIEAAIKAGVSAYIVDGIQADRLKPILDVAVARFEQDRELRRELHTAHERLAERKVIERAKGILMKQKNIPEEEAFRLMRNLAMERNRKLFDIAQQLIDMAELLT